MTILRSRRAVPLTTCLVVLALLAACSSAGRTTVEIKKTQEIPQNSTATLQVASVTKKPHKYQFEIEQLIQKDLSAGLVNAGLFKAVDRQSNASDYRIDLQIERVRIRSATARVLFGFMAGRSYIKVRVEVHDAKTDAMVTSFQTIGYGAKTMIGAQSYGYDDPVREVVNKVILSLR